MRGIIQKEKECFICYRTKDLECHHIFGGANRKWSTKYGLMVWLCHEHHTGDSGVHFNKKMMQGFHELGQKAFEERFGTREEFMRIFGKNYL